LKLQSENFPKFREIVDIFLNFFPHLQNNKEIFFQGQLEIDSSIPMQSGLGSSAAYCVAFTKWMLFISGEKIDLLKQIDIATEMESLFHGQSSGMDVACVAFEKPIIFKKGEVPRSMPEWEIFQEWFELRDSGVRGQTSYAVQKVNSIRAKDLLKFDQIDLEMNLAVLESIQGFGMFVRGEVTEHKCLEILIKSIKMADKCFLEWGLYEDSNRMLLSQRENFQRLSQATKITGSGMGGYWIVLLKKLTQEG